MTPCAACYLVLNKTKHYFARLTRRSKETIDRALGSRRPALTAATRRCAIRWTCCSTTSAWKPSSRRCVQPLKGLKVAPYYGCQIVRPYATFDDQCNPTTMDRLLAALGATVVHYPLKTKCCGGSLTGTVPEAGLRMVYILLKEAKRRGADCHRHRLPALPVQPGRLSRPD